MSEYCKHVYEDLPTPCPECGGETHQTDWKLIANQHREWISSGKAVLQGWWSI